MRRRKKQMPKFDYNNLIIHFADNLNIALDKAMMTVKDLSRLTDIPTKHIRKYMRGRELPTTEEYDKMRIVLNFTEIQTADYRYEYDNQKTNKKNRQ